MKDSRSGIAGILTIEKKIRTFRPLANKEDLPLSRCVSSICRRRGERARETETPRCASLVRQDVFARGNVRILEKKRENRLSSRGISLSAIDSPTPGSPLPRTPRPRRGGKEKKTEEAGVPTTGVVVEIKILMVRFRSTDGTIG